MAQLVERFVRNEQVSGSSPLSSMGIDSRPALRFSQGRAAFFVCGGGLPAPILGSQKVRSQS